MDQTQPSAIAFNYSRYAQRVARRDASLYERVVASIDERPPLPAWRRELATTDASTIDDILRRMRRELMLRTVLRDLVKAAPLDELVTDLSDFADLALTSATAAHSQTIFGSVQPPCGFSTVAMGKLGAQELNASSDIDIVFICDEPDADAMDSLNLLARRVTRSLN